MQQKWWLVAAGIVGIGLAILLFPRPDTGDFPEADPTNRRPLDFRGDAPDRRVAMPPGTVPSATDAPPERRVTSPASERLRVDVPRNGPNPIAAINLKNITQESIHAGRAAGPWTVIRRQLLRMEGDPDALAFAEEFDEMLEKLRQLRIEPESGDYAALEREQKRFLETLKSREAWMADPILKAAADRLDLIHNAYHEALAAEANGAQE